MDIALTCRNQPILDTKNETFAYAFEVNKLPNFNNAGDIPALAEEFYEEILENFDLDNSTCFLYLPRDFLTAKALPDYESKDLIIEIEPQWAKDADCLLTMKDLRKAGHNFCLRNYDGSELANKLLPICRYAKISVEQNDSLAKIEAHLKHIQAEGVTPIASQVTTEEIRNQVMELGFEYYQGYFFTNPIITEDASLSANYLALVRLMSEINDPDADFKTLSDIISRDVGLSHKLLTAINHPSNNLPIYVENIQMAVQFMGLRRLKFWVNMMILANMDDTPKALMVTSLVRAKFLELLSEATDHKKEKDSFFLVGLFSTLNAFFHMPMIDLVNELPLADNIKEALVDLSGPMGRALHLVKALEQGSTNLAELKFENLEISEISLHFMKANSWAHQILNSL